jgi:hypothetical protein
MGFMPNRSSPKRDFMEVARGIVEQAIGESMDGSPLSFATTFGTSKNFATYCPKITLWVYKRTRCSS